MKKKKLPEPVEALILALFVFFGIILFAATIRLLISGIFKIDLSETSTNIIFQFSKSFFLIVPFYYASKKNYSTNILFRFKPVSGQIIVLAVILAISLFVIIDEVDRLITSVIPPPDAIKELMKPIQINNSFQWIFLFIASVFVAAVAEEGLFRGFLQVTLENKGDATRAVILTSVSWAIIYPNPYWAIPVFILGIFIGFVAWKTKSIWPAVVIHSTYNFLSLIIVNKNIADKLEWYTMGNHISPVIFVLALAGLYYTIKNLDGRVTDSTVSS